jgi:hypothetical protein
MEVPGRFLENHRYRQRIAQLHKSNAGRVGIAAIALLGVKGMIWLLLAYWVL